MKYKCISIVVLLLCVLTGCGQSEEDMYGGEPPYDGLEGTVVESSEKENQILVEITGPEHMITPGNFYGFEKGEKVLIKYDSWGDFEDEAPKKGMYVEFRFLSKNMDSKEEFEKKDGYIYIEAESLDKNISFVNGKWNEGTYD